MIATALQEGSRLYSHFKWTPRERGDFELCVSLIGMGALEQAPMADALQRCFRIAVVSPAPHAPRLPLVRIASSKEYAFVHRLYSAVPEAASAVPPPWYALAAPLGAI